MGQNRGIPISYLVFLTSYFAYLPVNFPFRAYTTHERVVNGMVMNVSHGEWGMWNGLDCFLQ